ncbi:MAG: hypothetical protein ACMZ7B_03605 [Balneola sp.]
MKYTKTLTTLFIAFFAVVSCTDFVQEVDDPIDVIPGETLLSEDQVRFSLNGVAGRFAVNYDALTVIAAGLSDAWEFESDVVSDATFPTFGEIDEGDIPIDNNSVDGPFNTLGQARYLADDLIDKITQITFEDTDLQAEANFYAHVYAALTRANYAAYFGSSVTERGGVIDNSPLIPPATLNADAITLLTTARGLYSAGSYEVKLVNTLIGRIHLYEGNYSDAASFLNAGLVSGDAPFQSLNSLESQNNFYTQAGISRTQFSVDRRFGGYIAADANEANRLDIEEVSDAAELTDAAETNGTTFWRSSLQPDAPLNIVSWQENNLMRAEVALRSTPADAATALTLVNEVRAAYTIAPLVAVDLAALEVEREKELLHTPNRLLDQRRFGSWHLPAGTWQWFPITQSERNNNPNF